MEKLGFCHNNGKPIIGRMEYDEAVLKVNEIVAWINEQDRMKAVGKLDETYDRMIEERNKVKEQQAEGGSMTQNENANI